MNHASKTFSNRDEVSIRRSALAKVYELLIKLSDKSETNLLTPTTTILEEHGLEVTLNPSAELETEKIAEIEPASILKSAT